MEMMSRRAACYGAHVGDRVIGDGVYRPTT
jgi:hypothetical protein